MRILFFILLFTFNLLAKNILTDFNPKIVNINKVSITSMERHESDIWGDLFQCIISNEYNYCIRDDHKIFYRISKYVNHTTYMEFFDYKTGKILKEGNYNDEAIGVWKAYDYKNRKIKYINFNKKPRITKQAIIKWAKIQDPKWREEFASNAVITINRVWEVQFTSMDVFIDSQSGKILKYKLYFAFPDNNSYKKRKRKYKCVNREFKKKTKIYKIAKKCKLFEIVTDIIEDPID